MEFKKLTATGLTVSRLCLGTMTFGGQVTEDDAVRITHAAMDAGINFIDTANVYLDGLSESILGRALKGRRDDVILATKVRLTRHPEQPNSEGLNRRSMIKAAEDSLRRLQTDYIDIYYLHAPDTSTPIEETVDTLKTLTAAGKIRYWGISNYASWQVADADNAAQRLLAPRPVLSQNVYNLLCRSVEPELVPCLKHHKIGMTVYNPLAGGLLTGKHSIDHFTEGTRFDNNSEYQNRYWNEDSFRAVELLKPIAASEGLSLTELALRWCLDHSFVDSILIGISKMSHLENNTRIFEKPPLSEEAMKKCDEVWKEISGTRFAYNR